MQINSTATGTAFINSTSDLGAIISPRGPLVHAPVNTTGEFSRRLQARHWELMATQSN